jgi:hypothetical protein
MNRFVKTALAIAVAGSAAQAGTGDNEWTALDSEISGLASSLKPSQDGMGWAVLLRAVYSHSTDDIFTGGSNQPDLSGFNFNDVDIAFWGSQGSYSWRLSADIENNEAGIAGGQTTDLNLEDAYIRWNCGGYFDTTMGNYKPRLSHSNSVDPGHQLFIDRSAIGSAGDWWDNGIGVSGALEMFRFYAGIMNGVNGHTQDHLYFLRGEYDFGTGAGEYEGAMGSSDTLNATVGLTFIANDTLFFPPGGQSNGDFDGDGDTDNIAFLLDFHGSVSNFGFGAEVADFDDDFAAVTDEDYSNLVDSGDSGGALPFIPALLLVPDSMPFAVYGSYLINPNWEVGVRYEDLDNSDLPGSGVGGTGDDGPDNTVLSIGASWYSGSNAGKWQIQYSMIEADSSFNDGDILEVGYSIGTSR